MFVFVDSGVHKLSPSSTHALAAETWDRGVSRITPESAEGLCGPMYLED
jgi:hypothetical protein